MEYHDLIQGSPEWHAHRAKHFNASDAPAMLGLSPYKSRSQLLKELVTGLTPEVDEATQRRFDNGHRFEALARPLAEKIIGKKLYPVTGSSGLYSASFDGLTMDETINFEHKTLNADLRRVFDNEEPLPELYTSQMEQQHMISGAERTLFMASTWDEDGNLIEERHRWYEPDAEMRAKLVGGWSQFAIDLETYEHHAEPEKLAGRAPDQLPALRIEVTGMVTASNLAEFKETALTVFRGINTNLQTDQDFADAEKAVKFCKDAEEGLKAAKSHALSQTASIDELFRTVDAITEEARTVRLRLEKLIKAEKDNRRVEMIQKAQGEYRDHIDALNKRIGGNLMPSNMPPFAEAIKGLKSIDSMRDKIATAMTNAKIEADETAMRIAYNRSAVGDDMSLFPDFAQVCTKSEDDFAALLSMRINQRREAEEKRLAAERERIREEEERKARAKAEAEAAETLRQEREKQQQAQPVAQEAAQQVEQPAPSGIVIPPAGSCPEATMDNSRTAADTGERIKLGDINERLAGICKVSADDLASLGFPAVGRNRSAILFDEADWRSIITTMAQRLLAIRDIYREAA